MVGYVVIRPELNFLSVVMGFCLHPLIMPVVLPVMMLLLSTFLSRSSTGLADMPRTIIRDPSASFLSSYGSVVDLSIEYLLFSCFLNFRVVMSNIGRLLLINLTSFTTYSLFSCEDFTAVLLSISPYAFEFRTISSLSC